MKYQKAVFTAAALMLSGLVVFSGCAKKSPGEKALVRWSGYAYPEYDKFRAAESKKFEALNPGVEVRYDPIGGDFRSKILTQIAGKLAPDIFFVPIGDLSGFAKKGLLVDLSPYIEKDKEYFSQIHSILMKSQEIDGKCYALPGNCGTNLLYYNKALFNKAQLKYPDENWSWKELLAAAQKMTGTNEGKQEFGILIPNYLWPFIIYSNGGRIWNETRTKCVINSKESREALDFIRDLYQKHKVSPSPDELRDQGSGEQFIRGQVAMYFGSTWEISTFGIRKYAENLDWDACLVPKAAADKTRTYELQYNSLGVCTQSKNPELAYNLAKFMIESERVKFLIKVGDSLPMRNSGVEMDTYLKDKNRPAACKKEALEALKYVHNWADYWHPDIPYSEQEVILTRNIEKFYLDKKISSGAILADISTKFNNLYQQYKGTK